MCTVISCFELFHRVFQHSDLTGCQVAAKHGLLNIVGLFAITDDIYLKACGFQFVSEIGVGQHIVKLYNTVAGSDLLKTGIGDELHTAVLHAEDLRFAPDFGALCLQVGIVDTGRAISVPVGRETLETISEQFILSLIEKSAIAFKSCPSYESEKGKLITECLRNYWRYKHNQCTGFVIPGDMPVLQSVMSFFLKPFGFDQIERYMMNKKFTEKKYAMMLWAACNGYAALPKTFTSVLYQDEENYMDMDNLLEDIMHQLE